MFKNYLTYQFAVRFDQYCTLLNLPPKIQETLTSSSGAMLHHFTKSIYTPDPKERSKSIFVALTTLRDCKNLLDENNVDQFEIQGRYEVLHGRFEQLCRQAAEAEGGQLRMLG